MEYFNRRLDQTCCFYPWVKLYWNQGDILKRITCLIRNTLRQNFIRVSKDVNINTSDNKGHELPGGTLTSAFGNTQLRFRIY